MAEPLVVQVMRRFKAQLLAREAREVRAMAAAWRDVERALEKQLEALAKELAAEKAAGLEGSQWRLFEKERYQALLRQTRHEINKYIADAERAIADEQAELAALGVQHADAALAASGVHASFSRLPVEAVENMVAMTREGAPLHELLSRTWPDAVEGMTTALVRGTALGWNPRKTAREMRDGLASGLNRVLCIARTEQLRAYREASRAEYAASGVVKGYRRLAAHDSRTCVACLLLDGQFSTLDTALDDHPNGRCAMVPVVDGMPDVTWQTGREWLEGQDAETQRAIMGPERWQAWREGRLELGDLVGTQQNDTWGGGVQVRPLKALLGMGGPAKPVDRIDFEATRPQHLGVAGNTQYMYAEGAPGREHVRSAPVQINEYLIRHTLEDHPERRAWVSSQARAIARVLNEPELVERSLRKSKAGYWRQTFVGRADGDEHEYVVVALSLANLPGEPDSEFHQIVTVHWAEWKDLYTADGRPRNRWILVGKQKTGI